jgi:hypothetical protein
MKDKEGKSSGEATPAPSAKRDKKKRRVEQKR